MKPILSPYQDELDKLSEERNYFDLYDDLPASTAWMQTIGTALGKVFGVTVDPLATQWEIDYTKKEMRCGSTENIYTRRGVLGLLLNGIGRLALGIPFPQTTKEAKTFAKAHSVDEKVAKHFGALSKFIDEIRTDHEIAQNYAGGERVVDTMHAQGYEGATEGLRMMAMDMKVRKEIAKITLDWTGELMRIVNGVASLDTQDTTSKPIAALKKEAIAHLQDVHAYTTISAALTLLWSGSIGQTIVNEPVIAAANGRNYAALLIGLYPENTDAITKTLDRAYHRNSAVFGEVLAFDNITVPEEQQVIKVGAKVHDELQEMKQLASHSGGHARYVLAKAEQYYHAENLGIEIVTPFFGYDAEAHALDVVAANESARDIARAIYEHGITKDVGESLDFTKEILEKLTPYPFLDLNDCKKEGNGTMSQRVAGADKGAPPKQKRDKEREKRSKESRNKDKRQMEGKDNKKNQEEVDKERGGYSILDKGDIDPLSRYLYIIGPYLGRISATAAKMRRILKVNDPLGFRGAYRRGKQLNSKVLYRHRLNDYKLFAKKEVDKNMSYGFALTGDLSGSTEQGYNGKNNRMIQDEILASAFLITEVAERIGEKVMVAIGFFCSGAETIKRAGFYLNRSNIVDDIKEHGGGTNVEAAGQNLAIDLQELQDFKVKNKTIVFITDGSFHSGEFLKTVEAAKKFNASIAYFQICENVDYGVQMCRELEKFAQANAKGIRIRTRNITTSGIERLPEAIAQLMKETIMAKV